MHTPVGVVRDIPRGFFSHENVFCAPEDKEIIKTAFIAVGQVWRSRQGAYSAVSALQSPVLFVREPLLWQEQQWDLKPKPLHEKSSCGTPVSLRTVGPVSVGIGKISLAAAVGMEYKPDSLMTFPLPSLCNQWLVLSFFLTTAFRLEYLKIRVFRGMLGRIRNDPWLYLCKKVGSLVSTQRILPQPLWCCRWDRYMQRGSRCCK